MSIGWRFFSSASSSDCCRIVRFLSKLSFHCSPGSFQPGSRHQKRSQGWKLWPPFLSKVVYNCKDFLLLLHYNKVNKFAFKLARSETVDLFLLTRLIFVPCWALDWYIVREMYGKLTPIVWSNPLVITHLKTIENCRYVDLKHENMKTTSKSIQIVEENIENWKLQNVFVLVFTSPTVELPPCPRSLLKNGKELEACWPCLELFAPFTACTYSYLWYSQGKYLTLNRPLIRSSSTKTHNASCLPLICASLKKNVQSMFWRGLILVLLYPYLIKSQFCLLTSR